MTRIPLFLRAIEEARLETQNLQAGVRVPDQHPESVGEE